MKKGIILFLLFILLISCTKEENSNKSLVMGTCPIFPPFTYEDENLAIKGFEIELAKEIATDLGQTLSIKKMEFYNLIPALQNGEIDVIISSMTITDKRKQIIDFSTSYYETPRKILVRRDDTRFNNIKTEDDIDKNIKIASIKATTGVELAQRIVHSHNVLEFDCWEVMVQLLIDKELDAVVIDIGSIKKFLDEHKELTLLPLVLEKEEYGMAVDRKNSELLQSINLTISRLVNSGQYGRLVEEYVNAYYDAH